MKKNIYLECVLNEVPRLLGQLDKRPLSETYGSFDRQYWHYKTSDFSCARSQEAVLTLALLYCTKFDKNKYYKNSLILEWINAGLEFWTRIQKKNGSFDEWYSNENSFVATAFSLYAISETIILLGNKINKKERIIECLERASRWIISKHEEKVQNQEAGALIGLYNMHILTGKKEYKQSAEKRINLMEKNQNKEGWFYEYGGFDVGYLSLLISYLAQYYRKTKDNRVEKILKKALNFIKYFIHPDFTHGGEYGSRNTEYIIPDGIEIMAGSNTNAAMISNSLRTAIKKNNSVAPRSLDDRYITYILYNYLQAHVYSKHSESLKKNKGKKIFRKKFDEAGVFIDSSKNVYLIINYKKGGVTKAFFKKNKKMLIDSGIGIKVGKNKLTSNWIDGKNTFKMLENRIIINGKLRKITNNVITPVKSIALGLFQTTIGKNEKIGLMIKNVFRRKLITGAKENGTFSREIKIENGLEIKDKIKNIKGLEEIIISPVSAYNYTPSSRYFEENILGNDIIKIKLDEISKYKKGEVITIKRKYDQEGKLLKTELEKEDEK